MSATLEIGYDAALRALEAEIARCGAGDRLLLSFYLIEDGASSRAILAALDQAAARGASIRLALDATPASALSRVWERTTTLRAEAAALERDHPRRVRFEAQRVPDHSKYAVFERRDGVVAMLGGINLGDRFRAWRDFAVRVEGPAAARLVEALRGRDASGRLPDRGEVAFVANAPTCHHWGIRAAFARLFGTSDLVRYRCAVAYVDRTGVKLLGRALDRGARVELVLASRANVYPEANALALDRLARRARRGPGSLEVRAHPDMVHAKAILAWDAAGPRVACLGSANLKRNSLCYFGELNAWVGEPRFLEALGEGLSGLWEGATAEVPTVQAPLRAWIEEVLG